MIVYHVTSLKKFVRYLNNKSILPPVRAWESIEQAEIFSKKTGRRIILRLNFPDDCKRLEGHQNKAFVLNTVLHIKDILQ